MVPSGRGDGRGRERACDGCTVRGERGTVGQMSIPGEEEQSAHAERLAAMINELDDAAITSLAILDALAMSGLKLVRDDSGASDGAYRHAVEEIRGE
jgi:hypothetical protein